MAKAASPIRLQQELMDAATRSGKRLHRSAAEQVEYWADIGRTVASIVTPDTLLAVSTGLATLKVEPVMGAPVDPTQVFAQLERDRATGTLAKSAAGRGIRYQPSRNFPGSLERIDADGQITVGIFRSGKFIATDRPQSSPGE